MEIWDIYDAKRILLSRKWIRGQKARAGEYHIVVGIWVINSKSEILLTLRSPEKEAYPNKWENTGGSVLSGETSQEGALRELREETGIIANSYQLLNLGSYLEPNIIVDQYLIKQDIEINDLHLQPGETISAKWVTINEFEIMVQENQVAAPIVRRFSMIRHLILES